MTLTNLILIILFIVLTIIREYFNFKREKELIAQLKEVDKEVVTNEIGGNAENLIAYDDPDFDFAKANKVIINGQEKPLDIL